MATYPARSLGYQCISYLRRPITFNIGTAGIVQVGTIPAGCLVLRAYVVVTTAFNFGTNNLVKVGIVGSDASILSTVSLTTAGVIAATSVLATATATSTAPIVDTQIIATSLCTGTAGTAGAAHIVVEYAPVA